MTEATSSGDFIVSPIESTPNVTRQGMELLRHSMGVDKLQFTELEREWNEDYSAGQINVNNLVGEKYARFLRLYGAVKTKERWKGTAMTLREGLGFEELKSDLDRIRASGDVAAIAQKEEEVVHTIQDAVSAFPYSEGKYKPDEMVRDQQVDCVGASLLAGAFLSEIGIKYLVGDQPNHSNLIVLTADGRVTSREMLLPYDYNSDTGKELTGWMGDKRMTGEDIASYTRDPSDEPLMIRVGDNYMMALDPKKGHHEQMLLNIASQHMSNGQHEKAVEIYKQLIENNPKSLSGHDKLAATLFMLEQTEEALHEAEQAFQLNKHYPDVALQYAMAVILSNNIPRAVEASQYFIDLVEKEHIKNPELLSRRDYLKEYVRVQTSEEEV